MINRYKDIYRIPSDDSEPEPLPTICTNYTITVLYVVDNLNFKYINCAGEEDEIQVNGGTTDSVCAKVAPHTSASIHKYTIEVGGECTDEEEE